VENAFWGIDGGRCVANFAVILYTLPTNWARELKKHTKVDVFPMPQSRRKGGGADLTKPTWRKAGSFPYSGFAGNGPAIYYTVSPPHPTPLPSGGGLRPSPPLPLANAAAGLLAAGGGQPVRLPRRLDRQLRVGQRAQGLL